MRKKSIITVLVFMLTLFVNAQQDDFKTINFERADSIAKKYEGKDLYNLPVLVLLLTAQLETDVERFRAIYYWVTHNIKGSYHLTSTNAYKHRKFANDPIAMQKWNREFKKIVFKTLRDEKQTLCTGYAYLIKELSTLAGLECEIIHGYGRITKLKLNPTKAANHSWNAVKLNGKWYLSDATWSSGSINMGDYTFEFNYDDSFFLTDPVEFSKNHIPVDEKWSLLTNLK